MFSDATINEDSTPSFEMGNVLGIFMSVAKWVLIGVLFVVAIVAPALVAYCRLGADADADGAVSRAEYDANVDTVLGTGVFSYVKPVMKFWERIIFIGLPVVET